jgi:aldose sugar dehydrogenase
MIAAHLDSIGTRVIDTSRYLYGQYGRFRDVCISPDGRIFLATSNLDGKGTPKEGDDRIVMLYNSETIGSVDPEDHLNIAFTPNPMTGTASSLTVPDLYIGSSYSIVDGVGHIVRNGIITSSRSTIERGSLPKGMYFLRIHTKIPHSEMFVVN